MEFFFALDCVLIPRFKSDAMVFVWAHIVKKWIDKNRKSGEKLWRDSEMVEVILQRIGVISFEAPLRTLTTPSLQYLISKENDTANKDDGPQYG